MNDVTRELIVAASHLVEVTRKGMTPYIRENGRHGKTSAWAELVQAVDDYNKTPENPHPEAMDKAAEEWAAAWRVIVRALKEMGVTDVDHNAAAIIARLSNAGMLIVPAENVKD